MPCWAVNALVIIAGAIDSFAIGLFLWLVL